MFNSGGRVGFGNGSRGFDIGKFREQMIQDMIKKSPDGIVMDGERDTSILDTLRDIYDDKNKPQGYIEFDDGTIYYPKFNEFYKMDGTQVDGISPGAKPLPPPPSSSMQTFDPPKYKEAAQGGLMSIPVRKNSEGTTELDYRKSGGFVPIGVKEKADDVPAMLSKNEFVMTADAVRAAGGGSIEKGAQKMYDTMKKLESRVA